MKVLLMTDLHYTEGLISENTRMCYLSLDKVKKISPLFPECDLCFFLGDLVNGTEDEAFDLHNLNEVKRLLDRFHFHYVLGNHDAFSFDKDRIMPVVPGIGAVDSFTVNGITFITLDANFTEDSLSYSRTHGEWTNACIPSAQQNWLKDQLQQCEKAVILCHQNLHGSNKENPHMIRNAAQIRKILEESGKVTTVFQGHDHKGNDCTVNGIRYHTLKGMCEKRNIPWCIAEIDNNTIQIRDFLLEL